MEKSPPILLCLILKWKIQMKVRASEEDEVASDLENDSDPQGSSCSESITENIRAKTKAKAYSSKEKPRASTSKQSRKKGNGPSESYSESSSEEDEVPVSDIENGGDSQDSYSSKVLQDTTLKHLLELKPHSGILNTQNSQQTIVVLSLQ